MQRTWGRSMRAALKKSCKASVSGAGCVVGDVVREESQGTQLMQSLQDIVKDSGFFSK